MGVWLVGDRDNLGSAGRCWAVGVGAGQGDFIAQAPVLGTLGDEAGNWSPPNWAMKFLFMQVRDFLWNPGWLHNVGTADPH